MSVMSTKKVVLIGDSDCGKSYLFYRLRRIARDELDAAGKFNEIMNTVEIDGRSVRLDVQQEPYGQYEHDIQYVDASIILICFAIDQIESLKSVSEKWIPEVLHHCSQPPVPYILVGCKSDVREGGVDLEGNEGRIVSVEEAQAVARKIGAVGYMECSALVGEGVPELLQYVARVALSNEDERRDGKCIISNAQMDPSDETHPRF